MLSYDAGPTDTPILEETIGANFERTVTAYPDTLALVDRGQGLRYTYAELNAEVDLIARGLMARGVDKGDRVGVWSPNCAQWIVTQLATAKIGAILVNVNPAYRVHELAYALGQSGMRLLVSATSFKTSDYAAMIDEVRPQVPSLSDVVFLDGADWDRLRADSARVGADVLAARQATLANTDPINIQYTSGTTGFPKGATLSHRNILNNGYFTTEGIKLTAG
ncbi:AMP-binding protein, partial [Mycolicibacterium mucogenicum]